MNYSQRPMPRKSMSKTGRGPNEKVRGEIRFIEFRRQETSRHQQGDALLWVGFDILPPCVEVASARHTYQTNHDIRFLCFGHWEEEESKKAGRE